ARLAPCTRRPCRPPPSRRTPPPPPPPPDAPLPPCAVLLLSVLTSTRSVPWLKIAPPIPAPPPPPPPPAPPCATPFFSVTCCKVRLPVDEIAKMRKFGVPPAVSR